MKLRKVDYELPGNKALSIQETVPLEYHDIVGIFGKNGAGKTRFLKAVYNTIEAASVNKILEKAGLTIYTEQFENIMNLYINILQFVIIVN